MITIYICHKQKGDEQIVNITNTLDIKQNKECLVVNERDVNLQRFGNQPLDGILVWNHVLP